MKSTYGTFTYVPNVFFKNIWKSELWLTVDFHSLTILVNKEIEFPFNTTGAIMCYASFAQ